MKQHTMHIPIYNLDKHLDLVKRLSQIYFPVTQNSVQTKHIYKNDDSIMTRDRCVVLNVIA